MNFKPIVTRAGLAVVVGVGFILTLPVDNLWGGDYYTSVPFLPTVNIGVDSEGATPVDKVYGKEYSHTDWFSVYHGLSPHPLGNPNLLNVEDHDAFAATDPLQVVSWDGAPNPVTGNSGSVDAFDYGSALPGFTGQIDALANRSDFLLRQVVRNEATLLFSVTGDIDRSSVLPSPGSGSSAGIVPKAHVHYEDPAGPDAASVFDIWAGIEAPPAGLGTGPGVNHHGVADLDALEVWGPEPPRHDPNNPTPVKEGYLGGFPGPNTSDADRFSLDLDAATGTSVWAYDIPTRSVFPFIPHSEIVVAVEELFLGPELAFDPESRRRIDVDGTMVYDGGGDPGTAASWDVGDELLFTIDPLSNATVIDPITGQVVGAAPLIDGGEIMHLVKTKPGLGPGTFSIAFLSHGGHLWDTAFDVSGTFGYYFEDVDALEAVGSLTGGTGIDTPEPSTLSLLLTAFGILGLAPFGRGFKR